MQHSCGFEILEIVLVGHPACALRVRVRTFVVAVGAGRWAVIGVRRDQLSQSLTMTIQRSLKAADTELENRMPFPRHRLVLIQ
jgi:hypothetical protein